MIEILLLVAIFVLVLIFVLKKGFLAPANVFSLFSFGCLLTFYIVHTFEIKEKDVFFSAMPLNGLNPAVTITMLHYSFLVVLGWLACLGIRATSTSSRLPQLQSHWSKIERAINGKTGTLFLAGLLSMSIVHLIELDKSILWHNNIYQLIKDPKTIGITSEFGRLYHFLFRVVGLICLPLSIFYFRKRNIISFILSTVIASESLAILLAGNSRWVPLYFFCALAFNIQLNRAKISLLNILLFLLIIVSFLKVLIGRSQPDQGLSQTFNDLALISPSLLFHYLGGFVINVTEGAIGFANAILINPDYATIYKILSFSPLVSAIDGFDDIRELNAARINTFLPINAFAEVWHFGLGYMVVFYVGLFCWLRFTTIVFFRFGGATAMVFAVPSYWLAFTLQQYSIRTTWRFIIAIAIVTWIIDKIYKRRARFLRLRASGGRVVQVAN